MRPIFMNKHKELKEKYLIYYRKLPVQRLAAASIGRSEDTIIAWRKDDSDFSEQTEAARAEWAMANYVKVRDPQWLLERITRDSFSAVPTQELIERIDGIEKLIKDTQNANNTK